MTVFDTIDRIAVGDIRTKIRDILGAFMFGGEASDKKVKVLSGGERSRLAMIRLLLEPVNLLILDEPTNHLDMKSKDVLKDALKSFEGTVIVVSHDRDFLNGLVDKVYEFGGGRVKEHLGGIYEFLERKKMENLQELELSDKKNTTPEEVKTVKEDNTVMGSTLSYEERKELNRQIKRIEKKIAELENIIENKEKEIAELESKMNTIEGATDGGLFEQHSLMNKELSETMTQWEELTLELERMSIN